MKRFLIITYGLAFILMIVINAKAIPVSSRNGQWTALTGGASNASGLTTNEILWGTLCCPSGKNGLLYESAAPFDSPTGNTAFSLGKLTHFNAPIRLGTGADKATLRIGFDIGGASQAFDIEFGIDETPNNSAAPNDIIAFPTIYGSNAFAFADTSYTLELLGFFSGAGVFRNSISTPEYGDTTVELWARVNAAVPEPTPLLLIGLGLIALAGFNRKLKK